MRFFPSVTFNKSQLQVLLFTGLLFLAAGSFLVARWQGASTSAAVLCGLGPCTASTANTTISAAAGTVEFDTPATLTWHANNVDNQIAGVNCFGKDEISPCGTPFQTLFPGNQSKSKRPAGITLGTDEYLGFGINGDSSVLYKWISAPSYSEVSPLPVDTVGDGEVGISGTTQFDKSFSLDPGKTVRSISIYVTTPPGNGYASVKIAKRLNTSNTWTAVVQQGCSIGGVRDSWVECPLATPFTVPTNDTGTYTYYAGSYTNQNGGPLGQSNTTVASMYRGGDFDPTDGTKTNSTENSSNTTNVVRVTYTDSSTVSAGCFGNGSTCDIIYQTISGVSNARGGIRSFSVDGGNYIAVGQDGATSKIYKWLTSTTPNCFGSGSTCGAAFQDLGVASDKVRAGLEPFTVGGATYLAMGVTDGTDVSGLYKWQSAQSCFGDGTTCGALYQTVGGGKADGGWEVFTDGTDTYLALANNGAQSALFEWVPAVTSLGGAGGLTGMYFNNTTLSGTPVLTRQEAVGFNWGTASPGAGVNADGFSVRWIGTLVAPVTGPYVFYTGSDDGSWLYLNGNLVNYDWSTHSYNTKTSATINLTAGQQVSVLMGYFDNTSTAQMDFSWSYPGQVKQIVPASALYANYTHPACAGDGTYCGVPVQTMTSSYSDRSGTGGWKSVKINGETLLLLGNDGDLSQMYKFMTSIKPFEPSNTGLTTGGSNLLTLDKSWRVDNSRTVTTIAAWSPTYQTGAYVKLAKKTGTNTFDVVVSVPCTLQPWMWTECDIPDYTTDSSSEYYAGLYAPTAVARKSYQVARAARTGNSGIGVQTIAEGTENASEVRVTYSDANTAITPCLGNGYACGESLQDFPGSSNATYGWDTIKLGTDTYAALGSSGAASTVYRWMTALRCFGDGTTCGTATQQLDGAGGASPTGAALKFFGLNGKAYLASGGAGVDTKIYKGTEITQASISVDPSLTASTTQVSWAASSVTGCTVSGPAGKFTTWGPTVGTNFATTTRVTTTGVATGDVFTLTCTTASGSITKTATAYVGSNFWDANQVQTAGTWPVVWPMDIGSCTLDGGGCYEDNPFVSKFGATGLFGAHVRSMGVGTIVGQFGGHGPVASQGGGWEWVHTDPDSKRQFPDPPTKTKPEYYTPVVVNSGGVVDLEWTCHDQQDQRVPNDCPDPSGFTCGDLHTSKHVDYSDSTVGTNFSTGGALYGRKSVTVSADTVYSVQCISHHAAGGMQYPAMEIPVYITGSPNIPPPPQPPNTTGCTVYSYDSVNGTTTVATGNDSPVNGLTTAPLLRNTTFTLQCTIEGGTTEESSIRVLIPPVVSVTATGNAAEPSTAGQFLVSIEDVLDYPLTVNYTLGGVAVNGTDYTTIPLTVTIPAGQSGVAVTVAPIDDNLFEGNETVTLTATSGTGYRLGSPITATLTIVDDENAQSLPPSTKIPTFKTCTGTASATCTLGATPVPARKGGNVTISWYVPDIIKGANGNASGSCTISRTPTAAGTALPTTSTAGATSFINNTPGIAEPMQATTIFTLTCKAPDGTTATSTSKTVPLIPSFDEI